MKNHFLSLGRVLAAGLAIGFLPIGARAGAIYVGNETYGRIEQITTNGVQSVFATASVANPLGLAVDSAGNLYLVNPNANSIAKITTNGVSSVFAADPGNGSVLNGPAGLAFDNAGNLYVINETDGGSDFIEKFATNGSPTTFATDPGNGLVLSEPVCMAFDHNGKLYVANEAYGGTEFIEEFASNGSPTTFATDPGDNSELNDPFGMAFDTANNLYVVNNVESGTIEKFTSNGTPSVFAATGLLYPSGAAFDGANNLYVANEAAGFYNDTIVKYNTNGSSSVFGTNLADPSVLAFGGSGELFVADDDLIREFTTNGVNSIFVYDTTGDLQGLALDSAGNLYAASLTQDTVTKFNTNGTASTFAIAYGPFGLGFDSAGNLYVADQYTANIDKIAPNGAISVFASDPGNGSVLSYPEGLALDSAGNVYVVNFNTNTIEKFTTNGTPSVFASTGVNGPFGPALAFDKAGYLYAEAPATYPALYSIVKYAPNGTDTVFASDPGDGSVLDDPAGMAFDSAGNLYVLNLNSFTLEKFTTNGTPSVFVTFSEGGYNCITIQPDLSAALPILSITRSGTNAIVSWPVAAANFGLQSTPGLSSPGWASVTNTPATVNTNFVVTNGIAGAARFFRLTN